MWFSEWWISSFQKLIPLDKKGKNENGRVASPEKCTLPTLTDNHYIYWATVETWLLLTCHCFWNTNNFRNQRFTTIFCALKLINYSFLSILVKNLGTWITETLNICSRNRGPFLEKKKENWKLSRSPNRKEMYQLYLKIGKINEKVNTFFISAETSTSYFDVALNKHDAGQGSVFYVWSFSRHNLICLAVRKRFLRLNVIYRLKSNV